MRPYGIYEPIEVRFGNSGQEPTLLKEDSKPGTQNGLRSRVVVGLEAVVTFLSKEDFDGYALPGTISFFGAVFGGIHCAAWNATFPDTNGQLIWRFCCIVLIGCPAFFSSFLVIEGNDKESLRYKFFHTLFSAFFSVYAVARVHLIILIAYSFRSLPANAYTEVKWVSFIPQFS
ncbi:uncharacterized protein FOMMEDRAFT_160342 [Fomitiporia mediterranea MF3/22]|uniref:uncharacterized protein n=1 Tax=Fomitiporia mediterranea (strain MF3/22) TaxID=694068 RepID=UPI00044073CA|nr:uncharacterized protein FOMMEDRAFT_160342 [Fomitiporia mediterranea MF3/22]EJC99887.1 hypothetical protein FOMMEDRAFT_160342 [Fomitiporia mediterranea MF3/22]